MYTGTSQEHNSRYLQYVKSIDYFFHPHLDVYETAANWEGRVDFDGRENVEQFRMN